MTPALTIARERVRSFNQSVLEGSPVVKIQPKPPKSTIKFYGGAAELWKSTEPRVMLHGPAETGKTLAVMSLLDHFAWTNPGMQGGIVRKSYAPMPGTVLQTYEKKVLKMIGSTLSPNGVKKNGAQYPQSYDYPNGSRIWVGGLDKPGKVLSSERDIMAGNQCEEFTKSDWEILSTRTTGRAGVMSPARLIGDCNPGPSTHWIRQLAETGALRLIQSRHEDNPTLFDPVTHVITEQGKISLATLDALTGVRYKRLRLGLWVAAEGVVYDMYDPSVHIQNEPFSPFRRYVAGVDWGFTNPGVIQVWGIDSDGRMYRVKEVYMSQKLVAASTPEDSWWIKQAQALHKLYKIEMFACDPSEPQYIELFQRAGLPCCKAFNSITLGIQNIESRLKIQEDKKPRMILLRGSKQDPPDPILAAKHVPVCMEDEIEVYARPVEVSGKAIKEDPIDEHNHALDAARYAAAYVDELEPENEFVFA